MSSTPPRRPVLIGPDYAKNLERGQGGVSLVGKPDPGTTFVTAQRMFGGVHPLSSFNHVYRRSPLRLLISRCCHSLAATVLVAGCQIAHARDKRFYQWWTLVVLWVAHQLAE